VGNYSLVSPLLTIPFWLALGTAPSGPAPPPAPQVPAPAQASRDPARVLRDLAAPQADRAEAADALLALSERSAPELTALLAPGEATDGAREILLARIAAASWAPACLGEPLEVLARSPGAARLPAIAALGSVRTRQAAAVLVDLAVGHEGPVRAAALSALGRLSGRTDLGTDPAAWSAWFEQVRYLSEPEWRRTLAQGLAARADRLAVQRDRTLSRLVDWTRLVLVDMPSEARVQRLESLLSDPLDPMRRLGLELANRELANARTLPEGVGLAALPLLKDPSPSIRQAAADLVISLAPPGAARVLAGALLDERDPGVAGALLKAAARWPDASTRPAVLAWLESGGPAVPAATDAACALHEAGMLGGPDERARVLARLRESEPGALSTCGLRLLAAIGDDQDRRAVLGMLGSDRAAWRLRAAEALAGNVAQLEAVIGAADLDPALFMVAARAVAAHRPTLEGYLEVLRLRAPTPEERRSGLFTVAAGLSVPDLLGAARVTDDPAVRRALLGRVAGAGAGPVRPSFGPFGPDPAMVAALLIQAERGTAEPALAPGAEVPATGDEAPREPREVFLTRCLLWLGRTEQARALNGPASAWLDGLELSVSSGHAGRLADELEARFAGTLSAAEQARLGMLRARLGRQ